MQIYLFNYLLNWRKKDTLEMRCTLLSWSLRVLSGTRYLSASRASTWLIRCSSGTRYRSPLAGRHAARLTVHPLSRSRHDRQTASCPPCSIVIAIYTQYLHNNKSNIARKLYALKDNAPDILAATKKAVAAHVLHYFNKILSVLKAPKNLIL